MAQHLADVRQIFPGFEVQSGVGVPEVWNGMLGKPDWMLAATIATDPSAKQTIFRNLDAYADAGFAAGTAVVLPGDGASGTSEGFQFMVPMAAEGRAG